MGLAWLIWRQRRNDPEIDRSRITCVGAKVAPSRRRFPKALHFQCASEIVSTTTRHDQDGKVQFDQLWQMTMHGAVAAEDEDRVGLIGVSRQIEKPSHV